jgi:hypothetical protein
MPFLTAVLSLAAGVALGSAPPSQVARCQRGGADACREVGRALLLGEAGRPGTQARLGVAHVMLACELSDPPACADLGALHALGRGVAWDGPRAIALSRRACDAGVAYACANLGVLLAEEAGGLGGGQPGLEVTRRFRTACDGGAPEGCLDLAVALSAGAAGARDPDGAARALRRGCALGLALACHRLALALPAGEDRGDLLARACRAAVAPACQAAGLPVPAASVQTPAPRLVEEPASLALGIPGAGGFDPADLTPRTAPRTATGSLAPSPAVQAMVPPALRSRVGLDGPTGEAGPDAAIELLLPSRRLELSQCLDVPRAAPRSGARLAVSFLVEPDGRPGAVRAATSPAEPGVEACAAGVAAEWQFPIGSGRSGPFAVVVDLEALPGGVAPVYSGSSGLRPAPRDPTCLAAPAPPSEGTPVAARSVTLKLAVDPAGRAVLVHALTPAPWPAIAAAVEAVRGCAWAPGTGPDGRPAPVWTTATVTVGGGR